MRNTAKVTFYMILVLLGGFSVAYAQTSPLVCTDINSTLRSGSSNRSQVIELQNFLSNQGYFKSESTGNFGPVTVSAVKAFQKARGFETTGTLGPLTRAEIKKISCQVAVKPTPVVNTPVKTETQVAQVIKSTPKSDLPYNPDNFSDWKKNWGNITLKENGSMLLKSNESETSVHVSLPRSNDWTDYKYTASVSVTTGNIMLVARRVDDKNMLMCAFSGNIVQIQQKVNDKTTVVASTALTDMATTPYFLTSLNVSMRVKGKTVSCSLSGNDNVVYTDIDSKLAKGGIGIQSWYAAPGSARIEVNKISVEKAD